MLQVALPELSGTGRYTVKAFENGKLAVLLSAKGKKLTGGWRKIHDESLMFVLFAKYYIFSSSYDLQ
jgi:hypothetical protein